jgi:antirestriction protein ArdC
MHSRQPLTDEEREQRRAEQRELVKASIEQLRCSDGWRAYLRARRAFHTYSVGNVLLILHQHPTATRVAGFRAWLRLGYCVTKGSKAIRIWAPCPPTRQQLQAWKDAGADPREKPPVRWRLASVFAQDQVAPLPPPAVPTPLEAPSREIVGASHEDLIGPLVDLAGEIGYTVSFEATPQGDGYCAPRAQRIVVADRLGANGRLAVLIHELGHALLRSEPAGEELSYAQEELVVESIAMCVCQLVGLDTSQNSLPYLASWAEQASVEVLEQTVQLTDRVARRIEDRLLAQSAAVKPSEEALLDAGQAIAA